MLGVALGGAMSGLALLFIHIGPVAGTCINCPSCR